MKPLRTAALVAAFLALPFLFTGCNPGSGKIKVAFVSNNSDPFWTIAEEGTKKAAKEFDVDVIFKKPDMTEVGRQKEIIDSLLNQDIKGMAVSVIDPKNQAKYLNEVSKKVNLLTQDNDTLQDDPILKTGRICYIGTNNYEAGRAAGRLVAEAMPEGGEVAIFVGDLAALNAQQRRDGVCDELAGEKGAKPPNFGKYHLHKIYLDQPEGVQKARENATNALAELQDTIDAGKPVCFIGLWAYNPPQILGAVKDKKLVGKVKIVGFDEHFDTLNGIIDGSIYGTVVQQPYLFGYESVRLLAALARGDKAVVPANGILYVPHYVLTKEGKPLTTSEGKDLPKLTADGKTAAFWKDDLEKKLGLK